MKAGNGRGSGVAEDGMAGSTCQAGGVAGDMEPDALIEQMKTVNRQVVFDVLEKIRASKNTDFIPVLED